MKRICKQCGKEFELSESEIGFYKGRGLELPKRCKACREQNKGQGSLTNQGQKPAKMYSADPSLDNNGNNNRNDKSRFVISAVAVLLIFLVFLIKGIFAIPVEEVSVKDNPALPDIQETQAWLLSDIPSEAQAAEPKEQEMAAQETVEPSASIGETAADVEPAVTEYSFRKPQYLTEHFQKHGAEFPYATQEEYLLGANNVIQNPNALHKLEAEDGDDVYYVEGTREFVVVSTDGYIRTYFLTDLDYYNRQ